MQINPLATPGPGNSSSATSVTQQTDDMFLKLLTTQLKNQTPFNPVDPMQFSSELVQFNMLDQLSQIRSLLQQAASATTTGGN